MSLISDFKDAIIAANSDVPQIVRDFAPKWRHDDGIQRFRVKGPKGGRNLTYHEAYDAILDTATVKWDGKGVRVITRGGLHRLMELNTTFENIVVTRINRHVRESQS